MKIPLTEAPNVFASVSEISDGSMVWLNTVPIDSAIEKNRNAFFAKEGIDPGRVVSGGLIHGTRIVVAGENQAGDYLLNTDALVTNIPNLFLTITFADCSPVFFYDPAKRAVGIAHAGWRGTVAGILENVIAEMQTQFGSRPEDVIVLIGPNIKPHHYEVGPDVAEEFDAINIKHEDEKLYADLSGEAKLRLERAGVKDIRIDETCTYCSDNLFSARRDQATPLKGGAAIIGIREQVLLSV